MGVSSSEKVIEVEILGLGKLKLVATNAAFSRFRRLTRERGLGPTPETKPGEPAGRPKGLELRSGGWKDLDEESFPLLVAAMAAPNHPQISLEEIEDACTPAVMQGAGEVIIRHLTQALICILAPPEKEDPDRPDPPVEAETKRS